MEPLKPQEKQAIVDLGADPAEVEEYEALLAAQFSEDPDAPERAGEDDSASDDDGDSSTGELMVRGDGPQTRRAEQRAIRSRLRDLSTRFYPEGIKNTSEE